MPDPSKQPPSWPAWLRIFDEDLLRKWLEPPGVLALIVLAGAAAGAASAVVVLIATHQAQAALVVSALSLVLALVGIRLALGVPDPPPPPTPPTPEPFVGEPVGRGTEIGQIRWELQDGRVGAVAVFGRRGVGTSACANKAANEMGEDSVYLDLRSGPLPMPPEAVLAELAERLELPPGRGPGPLRARLSDGKKLLVLDNADDLDQVRSLFPAAGQRHKVLVAGTVKPPPPARVVEVHSLTPDAAADLLFAAVTGPDKPRAHAKWRELAELCGCQPRTIFAAGGLMPDRYKCGQLVDELTRITSAPAHTSSDGIVKPAEDGLAPIAKQDVAYAILSLPARRLLRALAVVPVLPGDEAAAVIDPAQGGRLALCPIDRDTMAAVSRLGADQASRARDELADAGFLGEPGARRALHPLHAPMARVHLLRDTTPRERRAAHTRLLRHLARQAERYSATRDAPSQEWFERNDALLRAMLLADVPPGAAAGASPPEPLPRWARWWWFRLAVALCVWYATVGRLDRWEAMCEAVGLLPRRRRQLLPSVALELAWRHNELAAIARRHGDLGLAADRQTDAAKAMPDWRHLGEAQIRTNEAVTFALQAERCQDEARRLEARAKDLHQDDAERRRVKARAERLHEWALDKAEEARLLRARSDEIGRALTEHVLGVTRHQERELVEARRHLVRAAGLFRAAGELRGEAVALANLVLVAGEMGSTGIALSHGKLALDRYDELQDRTGRDDVEGRAAALLNLGAVLARSSDRSELAEAKEWLEQSRRSRGGESSRGLGRTLLYLGVVEKELGHPDRARTLWQEARTILDKIGDHDGLAELGDHDGLAELK